ncbi:hypothetical protein QZH41_004356 [Actinostola sp. cb2023]|nr:hypothetical protein QZH41_004356 [Actinostola sp. cb2023]
MNGTEIGIQLMTVTVTVFGKEIGTVNGSVIEIEIGIGTAAVIVIVKNVFEMAVLVATDMWMERIRINTTEIKTATEKDRGGKMTINEKIELPGDPSKPDLHDSDIAVNGEVPDDLTTKGPSVHKLSALFGSSILKESKSSKQTKKADSKNNNAKQPKQEPKADSKKSDSKGTSSSRKFPWIKKGGDKKKDNLITNNDTTIETKFPFEGAQGLRPVQKKYAEHKITANMTLVIGADANFKNNQTYNHVKKTANYSNSLSPTTNKSKSIPESSIHSKKQSTNIDHDDEYITIIDVPDTSSHDDIQVSAIDIPSPSPSPTPISVIDMPEQKDSGVKVSIIDVPQDSDSDSDSATSGSYEVNPSDASSNVFTFNIDNSESVDGEEKEEEEDIDNVPVSYFGDSSYMKVPEVIFETEREDVKSCLSGPLRIRKVNRINHAT